MAARSSRAGPGATSLWTTLQGRRLVYVEETPEDGRLRAERVKALSGGARISARRMYGSTFEFDPIHKLVIATNHQPVVDSTDAAIWRRLRLVPFPHRYRDAHEMERGDRLIDRRLRERLRRGRAQREATLTGLVEGAVLWHRHGLGRSRTIEAATAAWRRAEDAIARFTDERLVLDPEAKCGGQEIYDDYRAWCADEGRPPKSAKNFAREWLDHEVIGRAGVVRGMAKGRVVYRGVRRRAAT